MTGQSTHQTRIAEKLLHAGEIRMRCMLRELANGVLLTDAQGVVRLVNSAARRLLGFMGNVEGERITSLPPLMMNQLGRPLRLLLNQQVEFDHPMQIPAGEHVRQLLIRGRAVQESGQPVQEYLFLVDEHVESGERDQERVRLAEKLKRSQRLESYGLMAAGISHDLNNVLTCVMGSADMLLHKAKDKSSEQAMARTIVESAEHGSQMTRKLLSMARMEPGNPAPVNLRHVVHDVMLLVRRGMGPNVDIVTDLMEERLFINGDTADLHQLLLNLVINARDALREDGRIEIRTRSCLLRECRKRVRSREQNAREILPAQDLDDRCKMVRLDVTDNGCGMSPALMSQVFEPFFTTKDVNKGTGLGLHMVRNTVANAGGWMALHSQPGQGTRFSLAFPVSEENATSSSGNKPNPKQLVEGNGRILVVEDDANVRRTMTEILMVLGYQVDVAEDGLAAIELYEQQPERWDLVLMDLKMPRMDGVETLSRMFKLNGEQRVLVSTGYANGELMDRLQLLGDIPLINKPVRIAQLSQELARLMN